MALVLTLIINSILCHLNEGTFRPHITFLFQFDLLLCFILHSGRSAIHIGRLHVWRRVAQIRKRKKYIVGVTLIYLDKSLHLFITSHKTMEIFFDCFYLCSFQIKLCFFVFSRHLLSHFAAPLFFGLVQNLLNCCLIHQSSLLSEQRVSSCLVIGRL